VAFLGRNTKRLKVSVRQKMGRKKSDGVRVPRPRRNISRLIDRVQRAKWKKKFHDRKMIKFAGNKKTVMVSIRQKRRKFFKNVLIPLLCRLIKSLPQKSAAISLVQPTQNIKHIIALVPRRPQNITHQNSGYFVVHSFLLTLQDAPELTMVVFRRSSSDKKET